MTEWIPIRSLDQVSRDCIDDLYNFPLDLISELPPFPWRKSQAVWRSGTRTTWPRCSTLRVCSTCTRWPNRILWEKVVSSPRKLCAQIGLSQVKTSLFMKTWRIFRFPWLSGSRSDCLTSEPDISVTSPKLGSRIYVATLGRLVDILTKDNPR